MNNTIYDPNMDKDRIAIWIHQDAKIRGPLYVKVVENVMRKCIDSCIRLDYYIEEGYSLNIRMFGDILDRQLMDIIHPDRRGPMLHYLILDQLHKLSDTYVRYNGNLNRYNTYTDVTDLIYNYDYIISEITSIQRDTKLNQLIPPHDSMSSLCDDFKENPEDKNPREYLSDSPLSDTSDSTSSNNHTIDNH